MPKKSRKFKSKCRHKVHIVRLKKSPPASKSKWLTEKESAKLNIKAPVTIIVSYRAWHPSNTADEEESGPELNQK